MQMGSRKSRSLLDLLAGVLPIFAASSAAQSSDSFYSLLRAHGLPIGLVPQNITNFTLDETSGRFEVYLDRSCSAKFESGFHYETNGIRVDVPTTGLIYFNVGGVVSKQFSLSLFDAPPECIDRGPVEVDDQTIRVLRFKRRAEEPQLKKRQ
uniref:Uncharacterized protein n=1 Tax=Kalanchoe fedtschenkoi TaxID=63787 RepID=A0A7N0ZYM3_KALFE